MTYDRTALTTRITITLNADLLRRVQDHTDNFSATVEALLGDFLKRRMAAGSVRRSKRKSEIDVHIAASNSFIERHGALADEFSDQ